MATLSSPASRIPRMTRTAISPRFATRMRLIEFGMGLEGDISVLFGRVLIAFVLDHLERGNQLWSGLRRYDNLVDVPTRRRHIRVSQALSILRFQSAPLRVRVGRLRKLVAE